MAGQYFYQRSGDSLGPVTFRELVNEVRAGAIDEDTLVRRGADGDWRTADAVVGLFYMARRNEPAAAAEGGDSAHSIGFELLESVHAAGLETSDDSIEIEEILATADSAPDWRDRMREVLQLKLRRAQAQAEDARAAGLPWRGRIQDAISEALARLEAQEEAAQKSERRSRLWGVASPRLLRAVYRGAFAVAAAWGVFVAIPKWSEAQTLRFPPRRAPDPNVETMKSFPLWGECTADEYQFLLWDVSLLAGFVGYGVARGLTRLTDE
ncbi:MAG: DUF4339 domain-containing protein [Planctomyces sp.]|nr:DUF4339 domain-containing protein [Planctomyces sp.]